MRRVTTTPPPTARSRGPYSARRGTSRADVRRSVGPCVLDGVRGAVHPQLAADDVTHLPGVRVLRHVRVGVRGHDEHACRRIRLVPDFLRALAPTREDDDVAFGEDALAFRRA